MTTKIANLSPGLYRVWWKNGGWSLCAIGLNGDGSNWLVAANWASPHPAPPSIWDGIRYAEPIPGGMDAAGSEDWEDTDEEDIPPPPKVKAPAKKLPRKGLPTDSGSKYVRTILPRVGNGPGVEADVYNVLDAYAVPCPAQAHAAKKLLCAGLRGKADRLRDLEECLDAVRRAVELERRRQDDSEDNEEDDP
jgi:hypothetical protein